ncbi:MAG: methyltransferase domain-containing protein [Acidobacteriota bacterium]|nr:methyltransferase domain-containing protein [Acidobacteriota bacterium]
MSHDSVTTFETGGAVSLYDRFADLYDITFKFNRYSHSIERYLRERALPLPENANVLDAGCGTGLLTLALLRTLRRPARVTAFDLSAPSLQKARGAVFKLPEARRHRVRFVQANLLALPFADETFDFVATSGALEYVPLGSGLSELARVTKPGGYLLHLPVRPAPASKLLELMFRFKTHDPAEIERHTSRHFRLLERHRFQPHEPIGWTKEALLAQKT